MREPKTFTSLEDLGRIRLSQHFYMRDFLYSEISNFYGIPNIPDDPDLAVAAGKAICTNLLDPLVNTFGPIAVRSSYRSSTLNHFGATEVKPQKCSSNDRNYASHIWDRRDADGAMGATACIVIPWFADQFEQGRDWQDLAWWVHDHLPYARQWYFPKLAAFNLTWHEIPAQSIHAYMPHAISLLKAGAEPDEPLRQRQARYADFPPLNGITYPQALTQR